MEHSPKNPGYASVSDPHQKHVFLAENLITNQIPHTPVIFCNNAETGVMHKKYNFQSPCPENQNLMCISHFYW